MIRRSVQRGRVFAGIDWGEVLTVQHDLWFILRLRDETQIKERLYLTPVPIVFGPAFAGWNIGGWLAS